MMTNPAEQLKTVPLTILLPDLLRQFNKPTLLGQRGVTLTKTQMDAIAQAIQNKQSLPDDTQAIIPAMQAIVHESITLLDEKFSLSFRHALQTTDISQVAKWETTADFLEIANVKSNAELRISAGTSILVFLGDATLADHLLTVIEVDAGANDVDAMIAKRALSTYAEIDIDTEDWLSKIQELLE
ncbi:MAG: hypothetical protein AAFV93_11330 [Chloroflexota bacterium]